MVWQKMSPPHALAADITGWQTPSCPQSLINLATRLNEGRESEKTNFHLPHMNLAWPVFKGWWWPLSIFRGPPTPTATEPVHKPRVAWPVLSRSSQKGEKQYRGGSKCVLSPHQPLALS